MSSAATLGQGPIEISKLVFSQNEAQCQRRARFDAGELDKLAESIRAHGVLQPILVRPYGKKYQVVAGERRVLASTIAKLETIDATVREIDDAQVVEIQLIENLQRADVHPMEEAEGYRELVSLGHPIEELHTRIGRSRTYVYSRMKLLDLIPAARKAFYAGRISASVAELLARIPVAGKLQAKALKDLEARDDDSPVSFRAAKRLVDRDYRTNLADAPFDRADAELVPNAGACGPCPMRLGNQSDMFGGEASRADVCTDPTCFRAKTRASAKLRIREARKTGQAVITGAEARKAMPYDWRDHIDGFTIATAKVYSDPKASRGADCRNAKTIVGPDVPPTLFQNPHTGAVIEVYPDRVVRAAIAAQTPKNRASASNPSTAAEAKRRLEIKFRRELYKRLRPRMAPPTLRAVADLLIRRLWSDSLRSLGTTRELTAKKSRHSNAPDWEATFQEELEKLEDAQVPELLADLYFADELNTPYSSDRKPDKLLAEAKRQGFDVAALRRELTPKKKAAKKKAAKKKKRQARKKG